MIKRELLALMVTVSVLSPMAAAAAEQKSMEILVEKYELKQCRSQLLALAEQVVGNRPHRLHLEQPKRNPDQYPLTIVGVVHYNDQDAHVEFHASPMAGGLCEVSAQEAFTLPETCIEVREQVFKEWQFIGRLSAQSFFLRHKEDLTQNATLSPVKGETLCQVTRRDSGM